MTRNMPIQRFADGSINVVHYAQVGRALRGKAVRSALLGVWRSFSLARE